MIDIKAERVNPPVPVREKEGLGELDEVGTTALAPSGPEMKKARRGQAKRTGASPVSGSYWTKVELPCSAPTPKRSSSKIPRLVVSGWLPVRRLHQIHKRIESRLGNRKQAPSHSVRQPREPVNYRRASRPPATATLRTKDTANEIDRDRRVDRALPRLARLHRPRPQSHQRGERRRARLPTSDNSRSRARARRRRSRNSSAASCCSTRRERIGPERETEVRAQLKKQWRGGEAPSN